MATQHSFFAALNKWLRTSITIKLLTIGILILILLIPTAMIESLIRERENTRNEAMDEVSSKWGGMQVIGGPIISVPYQTTFTNAAGEQVIQTNYAHFLPDQLDITCELKPEKRKRGIYVVVLYSTSVQIKCNFSRLNVAALDVSKESLQLNKAHINLGITDMTGIRTNTQLQLNDSTYGFQPGTISSDVFASGMSLPVDLSVWKPLELSIQLDLNGSSGIYFLPFGKENNVRLVSEWGNPSFEGAFLPDSSQINADRFEAFWNVLQLNRNYPQQGTGAYIGSKELTINTVNIKRYESYDPYGTTSWQQNNASPFGVRLILPVDEYQKNMRSAKYGTMFIILTFMTFFFIEVLNRKRLHPIQYLLIGAAICLFYVLLLSLSEHISFNSSYWIGCGIVILLVSLYAKAILGQLKYAAYIAIVLAVLYGFFYSLLQLQDYALLLGSIGLLLILATAMYLTRQIDWFKIQEASDTEE